MTRSAFSHVLSAIGASLLVPPAAVGCRFAEPQPLVKYESTVRQYRFARVPDDLLRMPQREKDGSIEISAYEELWIGDGVALVEARGAELERVGEEVVRRRFQSRRLYDPERDLRFTTSDGESSETSLSAVARSDRTRRRLDEIELVDAYLRAPQLRELEDIEDYRGDGKLIDYALELTYRGRAARRVGLSLAPGELWDIVVVDSIDQNELVEAEWLLVTLLGVASWESAAIVRRLGGVPLRVVIRLVPEATGAVVLEYAIRFAGETWDAEIAIAPPRGGEGWTIADIPEDADGLLAWLREAASQPAGLERAALILERCPRERLLGTVLDAYRETELGLVQIELGRVLLSRVPDETLPLFEADLEGDNILRAIQAAEVLIAEDDARATSAVLDLLDRATRLESDEGAIELASWAVRHLRLLSGMTLAELEAALIPEGAEEPLLDLEAAFWLEDWAPRSRLR